MRLYIDGVYRKGTWEDAFNVNDVFNVLINVSTVAVKSWNAGGPGGQCVYHY